MKPRLEKWIESLQSEHKHLQPQVSVCALERQRKSVGKERKGERERDVCEEVEAAAKEVDRVPPVRTQASPTPGDCVCIRETEKKSAGMRERVKENKMCAKRLKPRLDKWIESLQSEHKHLQPQVSVCVREREKARERVKERERCVRRG